MNTSEKIDRVAYLKNERAAKLQMIDDEKNKLISEIMTPEMRAKIEEINEEFSPKYQAVDSDESAKQSKAELEKLTAEIQAEVIAAGATIKGADYMAVLTPEKKEEIVIVDTGMLKGLSINIPKIKECFKEETKITPASVVIKKMTDSQKAKGK